MKGFVFGFAFLVAFAKTEEDIFGILMAGVEESAKECLHKVGATLDDLNSIMNHIVPTNPNGKCLVACIQKDFGIQNSDGHLNKEGAMESISPLKDSDENAYETLKPIFEKCVDEVHFEHDECETGARYKQCILDNLN